MKIVQVNYERDHRQGDPDRAAHQQDAAERIARLPGLVWKVWIYDDAQFAAGGIYLFDCDEHAKAWGQKLSDALAARPGVNGVDIRYFDVERELSAITRAPGMSRAGDGGGSSLGGDWVAAGGHG